MDYRASTYAAGSGNGVAGGNFNFEFYLLAGDAEGNGVVSGVVFQPAASYRGRRGIARTGVTTSTATAR